MKTSGFRGWWAVLIIAGAPFSAWCQSLTNGLIFYVPFTSAFTDVQGGRAATVGGAATLKPSGGINGGYLRLTNNSSASEQYLFYSDPTPATGDFSLQLWLRSSDPQNGQTSGDPALASNKDWNSGANVGWVLAQENVFSDVDKFQWNMNTAGGVRKDLDPLGNSQAGVFDGKWHQLVMSCQRSSNAVFYVDGSLLASVSISANAGQSIRPALGSWITNNILAIGQDASLRYDHASGTAVTSYNGDLDEIGMWNRALTAADVANAYIKATNAVPLNAPLPSAIVQQPQGGTRYIAESFLLTCVAAGDPSPAVQWFQDGHALLDATNSQLQLVNLALSNAGIYTVIASAAGSSVTSAPAILIVLSQPEPTGSIADVRHVVIFMQENRSFDHYFGTLRGVRGFADPAAVRFQNGRSDFYQPNGGGYLLPFGTTNQCLAGTAHDWTSTHNAWHLGKWDQWVASKGTTAMSFYKRNDLPFYFALAEAFTICDAYHCSVMGPTNPNRLYLWTGMIDPDGTGGGPIIDNSEPSAGFTWTTYPERLQAAGISWKVYQAADNYDDNALAWFAQYKNAGPGNPLHDRGIAIVPDLVTAFQNDVMNGTLPQVSWLIAPAALSEHPSYSPANGEALTKQFLDALAAKADVYQSTVFLLNYDENDGLFDHVVPPVPPPGTPGEFVAGQPIGLGVRVPLLIISPWTRGGYVCSQVFDHSSIIQFLERWTGVQEPNISAWRRQICGDLTSAFDFKNPNTNFPVLPSISGVSCPGGITPPLPAIQTFPAQESGTLIQRPLPYQPNGSSFTECASGRFYISMTNAGTAAIHFMIYPNAYRSDGPWQYDLLPGTSRSEFFLVTNGLYDLTCYGPNGFVRRFAGNINLACNLLEVSADLNSSGPAVVLYLRNSTGTAVTFNLTNSYSGGAGSLIVGADSTVTNEVSTEDGWYDLTVTIEGTSFLRQLAGHIESEAPRLKVAAAGSLVTLTYPDWASNYRLESASALATGPWSRLDALPMLVSNRAIVTISNSMQTLYFRLRH